MNSRRGANLVLLAVVMTLAWFALNPNTSEHHATVAPLSELGVEAISRIELKRPQQASMVFERRGTAWMMRSPIEFSADHFRIDALLNVTQATATPLANVNADDPEFGLSPPLARLVLDEVVIDFGASVPATGGRYMRYDDALYVIDDNWHSHLFSSPQRYLDPRPVAQLGMPSAIATAQMSWRQVAGRWQRTPDDATRSADDGQALAERWAYARALAVDPVDSSLNWSQHIDLYFPHRDKPLTLRIANAGRVVVFAREEPPLQYQFSTQQAAKLLSDTPPQ